MISVWRGTHGSSSMGVTSLVWSHRKPSQQNRPQIFLSITLNHIFPMFAHYKSRFRAHLQYPTWENWSDCCETHAGAGIVLGWAHPCTAHQSQGDLHSKPRVLWPHPATLSMQKQWQGNLSSRRTSASCPPCQGKEQVQLLPTSAQQGSALPHRNWFLWKLSDWWLCQQFLKS